MSGPSSGRDSGAGSGFQKALAGVLFAGFGVSVVVLLVHRAAGLYLPRDWPGYYGFLGVFFFGFAILVWALSAQPLWRRWRFAGPALVLGALSVWADVGPVARWSTERYLRQPELNSFAAWVHEYGRIAEMGVQDSGGITYLLNGTAVRRTRAGLDSLPSTAAPAAVLGDVLARDGIDPAVHERVRRQLRRFGLLGLSLHGDFVVFQRDSEVGLVYAAAGAPPLERGAVVPGTSYEVGERMGRWYFVRLRALPDLEDFLVIEGG